MWSQQALPLAACPSPLEPDYRATPGDLPANQARIGSNNATNAAGAHHPVKKRHRREQSLRKE
jgi:hypothetical protein